jgi:hypothetical protein
LADSDNREGRIDTFIEHLRDQFNMDGENALVLALRVLSDRLDPNDKCHQDLLELMSKLERLFDTERNEKQVINVAESCTSPQVYNSLEAQVGNTEDLKLRSVPVRGYRAKEVVDEEGRIRRLVIQETVDGKPIESI